MSKRKQHHPEFKIKVALEALKGEATTSELTSRFGVQPTMIHQWKRAFLEGAWGVFERGVRKVRKVDKEQVEDLHAKIGALAVANDFLARKRKPWTDRLRRSAGRISMDGKGEFLDSIFVERLWRWRKYECVYLHAWETGSEAKAGIKK